MQHLKSWSPFFTAIYEGRKTHDLRSEKDRTYHIGEILKLEEYDPFTGQYTGRWCTVEVTFITNDQTPCAFSSAVLEKGYCILSIKLIESGEVPNDE